MWNYFLLTDVIFNSQWVVASSGERKWERENERDVESVEKKGSWFYISKSLLAPASFPSMANVWRLNSWAWSRGYAYENILLFLFSSISIWVLEQRELWIHLRARRLVDRVNKPLSYYSSMSTDGHLVCIIHIIHYSNYFFFIQSNRFISLDKLTNLIFGRKIFRSMQRSNVNAQPIHTNFILSLVMIYSIHVPCTFIEYIGCLATIE